MSGEYLLIYICNFHVLSHFLLIYICKLHVRSLLNEHWSVFKLIYVYGFLRLI